MSRVKSKLALKLRSLRGNRTLYKIEQESGIPRPQLQRYEQGTAPEDETLTKLAQYYEVPFRELKMLYFEDLYPEDSENRKILREWLIESKDL